MENKNISDWRDDQYNMERYFSEWLNVIPEQDAQMLWQDGDRSFLVLATNGDSRYADCFESWEELKETYPEALFGLEKVE